MKRQLQFRIPAGQAGEPLAEFLARRFPYHDREDWAARAVAGRIAVNGKPAGAEQLLAANDLVEYIAHDIPEPEVCLDCGILHEDADMLIVNKPANLPSHPGGRYFNHTLWAVLKQRFPGNELALVNRLDRETSGIVVVARNAKAAVALRKQFATGTVEKKYVAIVEGEFPDTIRAQGFLMADPNAAVAKKRLFVPAERPPDGGDSDWAETGFRRLRIVGGLSEIEALPKTGRQHQIRATLQALGFPVVGDKLYGVDPTIFLRFCTDALTEDDRRKLRMDRQALHAAALTLRHPRYYKLMTFEAPVPEDMGRLRMERPTFNNDFRPPRCAKWLVQDISGQA
jgi:RluA family pseudouridine synthase